MIFDRYGTPGGPLAILLHGAVANRKTWLPLARAMPPQFEVWCPDLPGHGARRDEPFTLESARALIAELVARAKPRRPILAGDSLGGYLALIAAARAGARGVVAGGCTWSMTGAGGAIARLSDAPVALVTALAGDAAMLRLAESLVPRIATPADAREIVAAGLRLASRGESLHALRGLDLASVVRDVRAPIVFVNGRYDWPTRAGETGLVRAARDASVAIAPHCGHGVGLLAPETFAHAIVRVAS